MIIVNNDGDMVWVAEEHSSTIERGIIEDPLRRSDLPNELREIVLLNQNRPSHNPCSVSMTTADGKAQTVTTTADTKYTGMDAAIALKDIKVGDHVVIHATKKDGKLIATTVQIGMGKMAGMKMDSSASPQPSDSSCENSAWIRHYWDSAI